MKPYSKLLCLFCICLGGVSAQLLCPDKVETQNVTSRAECNQICLRYKNTQRGVVFRCSHATFTPIVNVTSHFHCLLNIETDWTLWVMNIRRQAGNGAAWRPYSMERYEEGFTLETGDYFGGTDIIAQITSSCSDCSLRFKMWDEDGNYGWAEYNEFSVANSLYKTLSLGALVRGNVGDGMEHQRGYHFSAAPHDWDEDVYYSIWAYKGPWWHSTFGKSCALNGNTGHQAIQWSAWKVGGPTRYIYRMEIYYKCKGASA